MPRLERLFDAIENDNILIRKVELPREKLDDDGLAKRYKIKKVPTVIMEADGDEIGRIKELPRSSYGKHLCKMY